MPIIRKRKISVSAAEISLQFSLGPADIRKTLKLYFALLSKTMGETYACTSCHSEVDISAYLINTIFAMFDKQTQKALCRWFVVQAEKMGLLTLNAADNGFFLNPELGKTVGRPKIEDK